MEGTNCDRLPSRMKKVWLISPFCFFFRLSFKAFTHSTEVDYNLRVSTVRKQMITPGIPLCLISHPYRWSQRWHWHICRGHEWTTNENIYRYLQYCTSRERHMSAPHLRLKKGKRTSKHEVFSSAAVPEKHKRGQNWLARGTFWDFLTSILLEIIEKFEGEPFSLVRFCMLR